MRASVVWSYLKRLPIGRKRACLAGVVAMRGSSHPATRSYLKRLPGGRKRACLAGVVAMRGSSHLSLGGPI